MRSGTHVFPRQESVIYGRPAAEVVAEQAARMSARRAIVVTSHSVAGTGLVADIISALGARFAGIFSECAAHSPRDSVLRGSAVAREAGADLLVAVGGGSVIDAAKMMLACLRFDLRTSADIDRLHAGEISQGAVASSKAPHSIAVPTTLSAAEFTCIAGITNTASGVKEIFEGSYLYVPTVVLDPAATATAPEWLFLSTGIRAVDHCVETLCSARPSLFADAMAFGGLRALARGLRGVKCDTTEMDTRLQCQLGAWLAISGPATGVPVGASHAIGRVLGGALGIAHGHTSCVLLPSVLRWNAMADANGQQQVLEALDAEQATAAEAVADLIRSLGQPTRLRDLKVERSAFSEIAEKSLVMVRYPMTSGNRRPVATVGDVIQILELAY
ncbi:MAG: iron-containing alcohol dehydrogenase [Hyphomonadaceae bacterium]|nr:iron-containing alcohol dehydrogenase [Hyphomonadaceae bacterium]